RLPSAWTFWCFSRLISPRSRNSSFSDRLHHPITPLLQLLAAPLLHQSINPLIRQSSSPFPHSLGVVALPLGLLPQRRPFAHYRHVAAGLDALAGFAAEADLVLARVQHGDFSFRFNLSPQFSVRPKDLAV